MEQFAIQGYSGGTYLMCVVDGDNIVQFDVLGGRQVIGKTSAAYAELETTTQEYYDKLVELGEIVPPKSQEQMMAEMQSAMADMAEIIKGLNARVKELSDSGSQPDSGDGGEDDSQRKPPRRGLPGAGSPEGDA